MQIKQRDTDVVLPTKKQTTGERMSDEEERLSKHIKHQSPSEFEVDKLLDSLSDEVRDTGSLRSGCLV